MSEMSAAVKDTLLRALDQYRGDNLARARRAFQGMSDGELEKEYGQSGKSRRQILTEYEHHAAEVALAEAFVWRVWSQSTQIRP